MSPKRTVGTRLKPDMVKRIEAIRKYLSEKHSLELNFSDTTRYLLKRAMDQIDAEAGGFDPQVDKPRKKK